MTYCDKGHHIPDNFMPSCCPTCTTESSERAMYELQFEYLRKAAGGERNYTLRVTKSPNRHVLMYTSFTRTFCGCELPVRHQIAYQLYNDETLSKVCAGCRAAIAAAVEEALAS